MSTGTVPTQYSDKQEMPMNTRQLLKYVNYATTPSHVAASQKAGWQTVCRWVPIQLKYPNFFLGKRPLLHHIFCWIIPFFAERFSLTLFHVRSDFLLLGSRRCQASLDDFHFLVFSTFISCLLPHAGLRDRERLSRMSCRLVRLRSCQGHLSVCHRLYLAAFTGNL
jgi:hypothetical protein